MTELEKQQAELIIKMAKQLSELHYLMGRLSGAYIYTSTYEQLVDAVDSILERFEEMKGLDE